MTQMRSYEAARTLYSFLGFLAWCVIIFGGISALMGLSAGSQFGGFGRGSAGLGAVMGMVPGLVIAFVGFLGLAIVQNGRAAVDTAELTQQMLQVARDQLDISQQSLKQKSGAPAAGFGEFVERQQPAPAAVPDGAAAASFAHRIAEAEDQQGDKPSVETTEYRGELIEHSDGKFIWKGTPFDSLADAKIHLDKLYHFSPESLGITNRNA